MGQHLRAIRAGRSFLHNTGEGTSDVHHAPCVRSLSLSALNGKCGSTLETLVAGGSPIIRLWEYRLACVPRSSRSS